MSSLWIGNLLSYSLQIAALLATGALALRFIPLPRVRLLCWQALLGACLLLPVVQPLGIQGGEVSIQTGPGRAIARATPAHGLGVFVYADWLLIILASGAAVRLGLFGLGLVRLRAYRRNSRLVRMLGTTELRAVNQIGGPVTFGFRKPVILVPERWADCEPVLCHELEHIRRNDWLFMVGEELIRAGLWFHPLVWYAIAQIQLAREEVVDRAVVRQTQSCGQYLETLLAIAAARSGLDLAPAPLFLKKRHLRKRVDSLLNEVSMSNIRLNLSLAGLLALTLTVGFVSVRAFPLMAQDDGSTHRIRVGGNVQSSKLIKKVTPVYPREAKMARIQGKVRLNVVIAKDGTVKDIQVESGPAELTESAITAVQQWVYETTLLNGEPVEVQTQVDVNYTLSE